MKRMLKVKCELFYDTMGTITMTKLDYRIPEKERDELDKERVVKAKKGLY